MLFEIVSGDPSTVTATFTKVERYLINDAINLKLLNQALRPDRLEAGDPFRSITAFLKSANFNALRYRKLRTSHMGAISSCLEDYQRDATEDEFLIAQELTKQLGAAATLLEEVNQSKLPESAIEEQILLTTVPDDPSDLLQ